MKINQAIIIYLAVVTIAGAGRAFALRSTIRTADGSYSVTVPNNWSGTISVNKAGWLITPASKSYTRVRANLVNENYLAFQPAISGYTGRQGVTITASGVGSVISDSSYYYSITVPYGWSGTVTATLAGYNFPESPRTYSNVTASIDNQNFTPYQPMISGYIKEGTGTGIEGVLILDDNGASLDYTDANGFYGIVVPYNWSGRILPTKSGLAFNPTFIDYNNVTEDLEAQDFIAYPDEYGGGSGTKQDPYLILSGSQLCNLGSRSEDWDKHFLMIADINMASIDPCMFNPIGNSVIPFTGTFDGQDHTIHKFQCSANYHYVGLFGYVSDPYALISNVHLNEPNITAVSQSHVAALAGYLQDGSAINCSVTSGIVTGDYEVGGIIGESKESNISRCYAEETTIIGRYYVGGIIGYSWFDEINLSYSKCEVHGFMHVGGLIGYSSGSRANECYAIGVVSGEDNVGGLIGYLTTFMIPDPIYVNNCYAACIVDANNGDAGGIIGFSAISSGPVANSYWDIDVSGQTGSFGGTGRTTAEMYSYVTYYGWGCSGIWVLDEGNDYPRFYYQGTSDETLDPNGYGGGSGQLEDPYLISSVEDLLWMTVFPCDWDKHFLMTADIDMGSYPFSEFGTIGRYREGSFPEIRPFSGCFDGNGHRISNMTYECTGSVSSVGLFEYVGGENAIIKDLILSNCNIVAESSGILAGRVESAKIINCKVIDSTIVGRFRNGGLVGKLSDSYMTDCASEGGLITGENSYSGGLIGEVDSSVILRSYSTTQLQNIGTSANSFGGLIGHAESSTISQCYATGDVTANTRVGGLIGHAQNSVYVEDCYARGDVETLDDTYCNIGGFVGIAAGGYIYNSYSTGHVSYHGFANEGVGGFIGLGSATVNNCFWDKDTSGRLTSDGGIPKTTTEMQTQSTFTYAVWDFIGETDSGYAEIWGMPDGGGYPVLWWQFSPLPDLPEFSGGSGVPADPFLVSNAIDLAHICNNPRLVTKHYKLTGNADCNGVNVAPIGNNIYPFTGVFDGNNHVIYNFLIDAPEEDNIGLFRYAVDSAAIMNVSVVDADVVGKYYVGGLVGYNEGAAIINCIFVGDVNGYQYVGGLAGYSESGPISNCHTISNVTADRYVGGLVGRAEKADITQCSSNSIVSSTLAETGGLAGYLYDCNVADCSSTGNITESGNMSGGLIGSLSACNVLRCYSHCQVEGDNYVGGLVGYGSGSGIIEISYADGNTTGNSNVGGFIGYFNSGEAIYCYAAGDVTGDSEVGGFAGRGRGGSLNCYATGDVNGIEIAGGFVGKHEGDIIYCYSRGMVYSLPDANYIGGLVGHHQSGSVNDCFWDVNSSGQASSSGGTGKTTEEMKSEATFTDAGWDFNDVWSICEGTNYPCLLWSIPAADFVCPDGINFVDFSFFAQKWLSTDCLSTNDCEGTDIDKSGVVDMDDLQEFTSYWLDGI